MKLLKISEAAERLSVSPQTIYGLCQRKLLRHVRIGVGRGAIRIYEEDLAAFVLGRTVEGSAEFPLTTSQPSLAAAFPRAREK